MNFQLLHVISQNFRSGVSTKFKRSPLNVYEIDNFRAKLQIKVANKGQSCRSANKTGLLPGKSFCNFWTSLLISWFWNVRFCLFSSIFWFFPRFYFFPNKIGQFQKIRHRSIASLTALSFSKSRDDRLAVVSTFGRTRFTTLRWLGTCLSPSR